MVTVAEVAKLRVVDLKSELKARGLVTTGLKAELAERLIEKLQAEGGEQEEQADQNGADDSAAADGEPAAEEDAGAAEETAGQPVERAAAAEELARETAQPAPEEKVTAPAVEPAKPAADEPADPAAATTDAPETTAVTVEAPEAAADTAEAAPSEPHVPTAMPDAASEQPAEEPAAALSSDVAEPEAAQPASDPSLATKPVADAVTAAEAPAMEAAEQMEDDAPEMDFDVEPEEDVIDAATKAAAAEAAKSAGKRGRDPIPGFKAPAKIAVTRRDSGSERPSKQQRTENSITPRPSAHSGVPTSTPQSRGGVPVPLPNMKPTAALRIDGFMRPFTLPQAKELLSQQGAVLQDFWMPSIKTHCFAIFEDADQAEAIRQATYNIQWPQDSHKRLQPRYVAIDEAEAAIANNGATPRASVTPRQAAQAAPISESPRAWNKVLCEQGLDARKDIMERRQQREAAGSSGRKAAKPEPADLSLDDLFRKTETQPHLYWLPVVKPAVKPAAKPVAKKPTAVADEDKKA